MENSQLKMINRSANNFNAGFNQHAEFCNLMRCFTAADNFVGELEY